MPDEILENIYIVQCNRTVSLSFFQWISDNHQTKNVGTLREFIDRDSESFNTASETISGILKQPFKRDKHVPPAGSSIVTQEQEESQSEVQGV